MNPPIHMRILLLLNFTCCLFADTLLAQAQTGYSLVGSAQSTSSKDCYQLTVARQGETGAVWFDEKLELTKSFELEFSLNFGSNTNGADGIAVVFQNQGKQTLGESGGGIGYRNLRSSLAIEFDTSYNPDLGDLTVDHVALTANGVNNHLLNTNFPPPVAISVTQNNVKDGRDHHVKITWQPNIHRLQVEVDCKIRIDQTIKLIDNIFSGTSVVYWGFTAATGSANNAQSVCLQKNELLPDTVKACYDELVVLNAPLSSNNQYHWSPVTDLNDPNRRAPRLTVKTDRVYTVQYVDRCNQPKFDSVVVVTKGIPLFIGDDQQACENDPIVLPTRPLSTTNSVTYNWSTGQTIPQIQPTASGLYSLTITTDGCTSSDSVALVFNPLPVLASTAISYDCPAGEPILLSANAVGSNLSYLWQPGNSSNQILEVSIPGKYSVKVTTNLGCSASQQFTVIDNCSPWQIHVPTAFTPNGDGVNDSLKWYGERLYDVQLKILNRWGDVIFLSTNSTPYWDGTYQGRPCNSDVYTWQLYSLSTSTTTPSISQGKTILLR